MKILAATSSDHKLGEIRAILDDPRLEILGLSQIAAPAPPEETGQTFEENARLKAAYYRRRTGLPSLSDDSGLVVDALDGGPGIHSARFASDDDGRIRRLLSCLEHLQSPADLPHRTARFVCALCLDLGHRRLETIGSVEGIVAIQPAGNAGFGYDPIFFYPPLKRTFGELPPEEKNRLSHRARALHQLKTALADVLNPGQPAG